MGVGNDPVMVFYHGCSRPRFPLCLGNTRKYPGEKGEGRTPLPMAWTTLKVDAVQKSDPGPREKGQILVDLTHPCGMEVRGHSLDSDPWYSDPWWIMVCVGSDHGVNQ
ncbi:hypothetical protein F2Q70_00000011 [Brassica cretica]|uniref:Uncharacterized protein n=1 Tax=Brassica cretica TaxID=69181 RepID=A0A8S9INC3_BRACR|nr:hypothetical protein F2Q70_00000011 [Brassica cretica]